MGLSVVLLKPEHGQFAAVSVNQQVTISRNLNRYADTLTVKLHLALQATVLGGQHVQITLKIAYHQVVSGDGRTGYLAPGQLVLNPQLPAVVATKRLDVTIGRGQVDIAVTDCR